MSYFRTAARRSTFMATALLLGACAPLPRYAGPASGDSATLTFETEAQGTSSVYLYESARECTGRSQVPNLVPKKSTTIAVPVTGYPFAVTYSLSIGNSYCNPTFSFTPEKDVKYLAQIDAAGGMCYIRFRDVTTISDAERAPVPLSYRRRAWKRAFTEGGAWCTP